MGRMEMMNQIGDNEERNKTILRKPGYEKRTEPGTSKYATGTC
jgi:hypothetical protein